MARPSYAPGIKRLNFSCSLPESTILLIKQWAVICRNEFEEMYPKDSELEHWPRGTGEVVEQAIQCWIESMMELERVADPVGFTALADMLPPDERRALFLKRYVTGGYFREIERIDGGPTLLFEGDDG